MRTIPTASVFLTSNFDRMKSFVKNTAAGRSKYESSPDSFMFAGNNGNLVRFRHAVGWSQEGIRFELDILDPGRDFESKFFSGSFKVGRVLMNATPV